MAGADWELLEAARELGRRGELPTVHVGRYVRVRPADLVAFGKLFIANPDLGRRLREDAPLNALDTKTLYGGGAAGYTDYPALAATSVAG